MINIGTWNTGSVVAAVMQRIDNIPTALSGTNMNSDVERAVSHIEEYTGLSIGTTAIAVKYQNAVMYKTCINILASIKALGMTGNTSLGDFSINKGSGDSTDNSIQVYENLLLQEKSILGKTFHYYKSNS